MHEARKAGQDIGPITIAKTTQGGARRGRSATFSAAKGFPVRLRGYRSGQLIDESTQVTSVCRALDANTEWFQLKAIFAEEREIAMSNVGDAGYDLAAEDQEFSASSGTAPRNFPMKLWALLFRRFERTGWSND